MEAIRRSFLKINGSYYIFSAVTILIYSTLISSIALISLHPEVNLFFLWMSDLATGPCGLLFNLSMIISSLLLFLFIIYFSNFLIIKGATQKLVALMFIFGSLSFLGLFAIGLFPVKQIGETTMIHSIAAVIYWINSSLFWSLLGVSEYLTPKIPKKLYFLTLNTAFLWAFFLIYLLISLLIPFYIINLGKFPQWLVHFVVAISFIAHGIYIFNEHTIFIAKVISREN